MREAPIESFTFNYGTFICTHCRALEGALDRRLRLQRHSAGESAIKRCYYLFHWTPRVNKSWAPAHNLKFVSFIRQAKSVCRCSQRLSWVVKQWSFCIASNNTQPCHRDYGQSTYTADKATGTCKFACLKKCIQSSFIWKTEKENKTHFHIWYCNT